MKNKPVKQAMQSLHNAILVKVVQLCAEHNEWETLNDQILAFTKKHGQLKAATQGMVAEAWGVLRNKDWKAEGRP